MKRSYEEYPYMKKHTTSREVLVKTILSLLGMVLCFVMFCSTTFAWFGMQQSSAVEPVRAATYFVSVTSGEVELYSEEKFTYKYICPLVKDDKHRFTLKASGTAKNGYFIIQATDEEDNEKTYAIKLEKEESITLDVQAAYGTWIEIFSYWGEYEGEYTSVEEEINISTTPYEIYIVEKNVTLEDIAEHYEVSEEDILIYNGINEEDIEEGMELKIPNTAVTEPLVISEEETEISEEETEETSEEKTNTEETFEKESEKASIEETAEAASSEEGTESISSEESLEVITSEISTEATSGGEASGNTEVSSEESSEVTTSEISSEVISGEEASISTEATTEQVTPEPTTEGTLPEPVTEISSSVQAEQPLPEQPFVQETTPVPTTQAVPEPTQPESTLEELTQAEGSISDFATKETPVPTVAEPVTQASAEQYQTQPEATTSQIQEVTAVMQPEQTQIETQRIEESTQIQTIAEPVTQTLVEQTTSEQSS